MPLLQATLFSSVLRRTDQDAEDFVGFPATFVDAGNSWAAVATEYYREAINPPLATVTSVGEAAFTAAFVPIASSGALGAGLTALDAGFAAYVVAVAGAVTGVVPGSITVPPVGQPGIASTFIVPTADPVVPANTFATLVDTWSRTGTYAVTAVSAPVPWS